MDVSRGQPTVYSLSKKTCWQCVSDSGSIRVGSCWAEANGRQPISGSGQVFNFNLSCFIMIVILWHKEVYPYLELKTQHWFLLVSLS